MNQQEADAIQWAITLADRQINRDARSQDERNHLHTLESLKRRCESYPHGTRAYEKPT